MATTNKHFQFLRKTLSSATYADAVSAIAEKVGVELKAGEPVIAFYSSGDTKGVVLGISDGSSTGSGYTFYNAATVDELIANLGTTLTGSDSDVAGTLTLKGLKKAITTAQSATTLASVDEVLVVTPTESGTTIDINYDDATIKSSGSGVTFANGTRTVAADTLYAADAVIEDSFKVLGGNVGQLTSGTEISGGTTVIELLKKMLVKEADCTVVNPTCTLTISPTTSPVEVGTTLSETLTSTYTDGKFTGSTADYGTAYSVAAGCTQGTVTYKRGTTVVTSPDSYTIPEGTTTWSCTSTYSASTVTPKKNNGEDSSKTIASGTTATSSKSITAYYKWYVGETTADTISGITLTGADANVSNVTTGWTTASTVTMMDSWKSSGKSIFVLVKGTLSSYKDSMTGASLIPNFNDKDKVADAVEKGVGVDKTIAIGGTSTATYKAYLWVITNGATIEGKEIKMTK